METKEASLPWSIISVGNSNSFRFKPLVALILTGRVWIRRYPCAGGPDSRRRPQQQVGSNVALMPFLLHPPQQINRAMQPTVLTHLPHTCCHARPFSQWFLVPAVCCGILLFWLGSRWSGIAVDHLNCFGASRLIWTGFNTFANAWTQSYQFWTVPVLQIDLVWMDSRQEIRRSIVILGIRIEGLLASH